MPPPPRRYDPGDRREKAEEMRRLAEMKRQREAGFVAPPAAAPAPRAAPEVRPGPKDARFEGAAAKKEEERRLRERRQHELLFGVRMRVAETSRWKEQAEAQGATVESRMRDIFGAKPTEKPGREKIRDRARRQR